MSLTRYLTNSTRIIERSIRRHSTTADTNSEGYIINNGTNRTLCTAVDTDGNIQVYAETNGDPLPLTDENAADFCRTIGDNSELQSGIDRLAAITDAIRDEDSTAADWIEGCVASAKSALLTPDEQNDEIRAAIESQIGRSTEETAEQHERLFAAACEATTASDGASEIRATVARLAR